MKINNVLYFEKINQAQEINAYICWVLLMKKWNDNIDDENAFSEDYLIEEEISSGIMSISLVAYKNPNL